jgi:predicted AAA+ superfamily ATPase
LTLRWKHCPSKEFLTLKEVSYQPVGLHEKELRLLFKQFVLTLGFPELSSVSDKDIIKKYTKESILEKIFYGDMPKLYNIRNIPVLESLINIFMEEPGQIVDVFEIAKELGVSRQTVSNYLSYLEEAFLLRKLYNFAHNRRKVERKLKKYCPTLISADLLFQADTLSESKVFEWMMVNQVKAEFFWRDPYKHEVDTVLTEPKVTPIEIKYGKISSEGLLAFMRQFKVDEGYIISGNEERVEQINGKTVFVKPAFKFLLDLG